MEPFNGTDRKASWAEALAVAYKGRLLASWELLGAVGEIARARQPGPVPEFWAFTVWNFPKYGKTYKELTQDELESLNDHWTRLGPAGSGGSSSPCSFLRWANPSVPVTVVRPTPLGYNILPCPDLTQTHSPERR